LDLLNIFDIPKVSFYWYELLCVYFLDTLDGDEVPDQQGCIVEHLICTRPLQSRYVIL